MNIRPIITQDYLNQLAKKVLESDIYKRKLEQAKLSHAKIDAASIKPNK